jgi:hypothetical protein
MKNGILTANLFPDSGHHFYFASLAIGQGQGTPAAQRYTRENDLPNLTPQLLSALSTLCTSGSDWMPAHSKDHKEFVWMRGKFGTKREPSPAGQDLVLLGLWCAIETNTGTRSDGYTLDVNYRPIENDAGWTRSRNSPALSPYMNESAEHIDFEHTQSIDLDTVFRVSETIGGPIGKCQLDINWLVRGGDPVPVSLVVDFGNTRTIAVGLERADRIATNGLKEIVRPISFGRGHDEAAPNNRGTTSRDLIPNSWIILREPAFSGDYFSSAQFVWPDYITERKQQALVSRVFAKGDTHRLIRIINRVPYMFTELSPVVLGPEATDLLADSDVAGGHLSFLSSPKRYSWDNDPVGRGGLSVWYMHPRTGIGKTRQLFGEIFRFLPKNPLLRKRLLYQDESVSPTEWTDESLRPTNRPTPDFGRGDALIWTALEIIERAAKQIQSEAWRSKSPVRRYLDGVTVTFPPGWTNEEFLAYWQAWFLAKEIYNWSRGPQSPKISLDLSLDEAVASQLAIVFSEIGKHGDQVEIWLQSGGRLRGKKTSIRVLTIDIGGGTTDTAVVEYSNSATAKSGVHLGAEVLFSDSTAHAGDRLVKDLIEAVLLPTLGERFRSNSQRAQIFERVFSTSTGMREAEDRLRRMVITRSVFLPIIYRWLEDISAEQEGNPATGAKWDPIGCGASSSQLEKLNVMFQDAGLSDDSLLPVGEPIDADYSKIRRCIREWCEPLANLHSRYARDFGCDLVIVTGKPSELPSVSDLLFEELPLARNKIIFAKNYEAGEWFPGAVGGKIPDAKLVTVVGAALYTAIKSGLIPNWNLDEKIAAEVRNCWGSMYESGIKFGDSDIILLPEEDEADVVLPTNCCIARARFIENEPEPVYTLRWRDGNVRARPTAEIRLRIGRVLHDSEGRPLRNEQLRILDIFEATASGEPIDASQIELRLQPLPFDQVHWLDQGRFNVRWD